MKSILKYHFIWMALSALLVSCSSEEENMPAHDGHGQLKLYASIVPANENATRAATDLTGKSYDAFATGDVMGLYSRDGNLNGTNGDHSFTNVSLVCGTYSSVDEEDRTHSVFLADNLNVDYNRFRPAAAYYPYYENMETAADPGMPIRKNDGTVEDILFCFSYSLRSSSGYISGGFEHAGARLIVTCGEGFNKVANQEITLRMNKPFKYFKVVDGDEPDGSYYKVPKYVPVSETEATEGDYVYKTYPVVETNGTTRYYAILPSSSNHIKDESSIGAGVESVTLKDNDGNVRTISTTNLDIHELWRSNNYYLTIKLENLVPTIYPYAIEPWGEETITTDAGTGINNIDELQSWMQTYNRDRSSSNEELKKYGSFNGTETDGQWLFYLTGDIDCSSITGLATFLNQFEDKLDGRGYTLSNITLTSKQDGGAGLVGTLSGNAVIENLHIEKITVNDNLSKSVGTIASVIEGGTVNNCTIEGLNVVGNNYAGALAGEMSAGSITGCTFIGTVAGKRNDKTNKLVGKGSGIPTMTGNNTANVIYNDRQ